MRALVHPTKMNPPSAAFRVAAKGSLAHRLPWPRCALRISPVCDFRPATPFLFRPNGVVQAADPHFRPIGADALPTIKDLPHPVGKAVLRGVIGAQNLYNEGPRAPVLVVMLPRMPISPRFILFRISVIISVLCLFGQLNTMAEIRSALLLDPFFGP